MGTTNIYNWPIPDYPDSADGPSSLGELGRAIETTVNTLTTRRVAYSANATPTALPGLTSLGDWPSAGGFVGNSNGITVPETGVYAVYLAATNLSKTVANPLTAVCISVTGGCRGYFPVGAVIASCSIIIPISAGGQINLRFDNREGVNVGTALVLTIAKVSP